jgi:hypothetical protein
MPRAYSSSIPVNHRLDLIDQYFVEKGILVLQSYIDFYPSHNNELVAKLFSLFFSNVLFSNGNSAFKVVIGEFTSLFPEMKNLHIYFFMHFVFISISLTRASRLN